MELTLTIPDTIAIQFNGGDVARRALVGWAVAEYQREALSVGEVAEMLGISVYEADGLLKQYGVEGQLSLTELDEQRAAFDALLGK